MKKKKKKQIAAQNEMSSYEARSNGDKENSKDSTAKKVNRW